jgi:hypothetical protein
MVEDSEMDQVVEMRNLIKDGTSVSRQQELPCFAQPFPSETIDAMTASEATHRRPS